MPRKIREIKAHLRRAGLKESPAKGSHARWEHPRLPGRHTLSGHDGDDARPYQEQQLRALLARLRDAHRRQP